ncbi:MAG: DsbA family protein [Thiotrichales bacterium]|nr:DsbA family protein [Thiotrichales bacterium]
MTAKLYYFHDPMCSWCWGYQSTWQKLLQELPENMGVTYILGGLAQDNDAPMPDDMQTAIQAHWRRIESELGAEFNFDFWQQCKPRRSTYPACRAVIAASNQDAGVMMILAIQRAYYLRAMNPSEYAVLSVLAEELDLDTEKFNVDILSVQTERDFQEQISYSRSMGVSSFPSLLLDYNNELYRLAVDYKNHQTTLDQIAEAIS